MRKEEERGGWVGVRRGGAGECEDGEGRGGWL